MKRKKIIVASVLVNLAHPQLQLRSLDSRVGQRVRTDSALVDRDQRFPLRREVQFLFEGREGLAIVRVREEALALAVE